MKNSMAEWIEVKELPGKSMKVEYPSSGYKTEDASDI